MTNMTRQEAVSEARGKPRIRGVTKNSAEARRKILESATLIFGAEGFERASTKEIAEHAGYGQATAFFHFKTKAGLLAACLEDALAHARQNLVAVEASGAVGLIRRLDRAFDSDPTAEFFARMLAEFGENSLVQPIYADFHAEVRDLIAVELARETGADEARARKAAAAILCMMVGVHAEQRLETRRFSRADFSEMLISTTQLILRDLAEAVARTS